jgi:hypothetical protein
MAIVRHGDLLMFERTKIRGNDATMLVKIKGVKKK